MRILAIGECMAELSPGDSPDTYRMGFAGDTFNTAWYLARCAPQVEVSYLTCVGDDATSDKMRQFIRDSGVKDRFIRSVPGKTVGLYVISLADGERSFSYWRGQSAAKELADDPQMLDAAMAEADLIYFSGITLAILPPEKCARLLAALGRARAAGKTIAFDPNLRPRLWLSDGRMKATVMEGAAVSDIALPSFEDEADWFGDATPAATAQRYLDQGAVTVIVKNGADPVHFVEGGTSAAVPVDALSKVTDTTAAGDSFNAGLFAGHAAGLPPAEGIAYACALSRIVVQHRGALVDVPLPALPEA